MYFLQSTIPVWTKFVPPDILNLFPTILKTFIFMVGLCLGSFFNAFIYRYQAKVSIWKKWRSFCPQCKHDIAWYDNIPLLSYILLWGKCRHCRGRISPRYFVVELLTGCLFLLLYQHFSMNYTHSLDRNPVYSIGRLLAMFYFVGGLVIITFVDIDVREIPDEVSLTGMALGPILSLAFPDMQILSFNSKRLYFAFFESAALNSFSTSIIGLLVGGGSIWLMAIVGEKIFKKEAMGFGDVKLMAMGGAFLGPIPIILVFFIAPIFGSIVGIVLLIRKGEHYIPYGPFLSFAMLLLIVYKWAIIGGLFAYIGLTTSFNIGVLPEKFPWF